MLVLGWTQIFQTLISVLPEMDFTKNSQIFPILLEILAVLSNLWQNPWGIPIQTFWCLVISPELNIQLKLIKIPTQIQLCYSRVEPITKTTSNPTFNKGQNGGQKGQKQKWWIDPLGTMWWCKRLLDLVFLTNFKFSSLLFTGFWDFL